MADEFKHFNRNEFACKCGRCVLNKIDPLLITALDRARAFAGVPFSINSGYRCADHNATLKNSSPTSSHVKGLAVDIHTGDNDGYRYRVVYGLLCAGFIRIGISRTFVHADIDPAKTQGVVWLYK